MLWYEVLAPVLILAGAAFFGWISMAGRAAPPAASAAANAWRTGCAS